MEIFDLREPVVVRPGKEYVLNLKMTQLTNRKDIRVHAPRFPKPKDESWFLTLGSVKSKELLSMKRFTFGRRIEVFHNLIYQVPNVTGDLNFSSIFTRGIFLMNYNNESHYFFHSRSRNDKYLPHV